MRFLYLSIFIKLLLVFSSTSFAFYARWVDDPIAACQEKDSLQTVTCNINPIPTQEIDSAFYQIVDDLKGSYVDAYEDIRSAYAISGKIIKESKKTQKLYSSELDKIKNGEKSKIYNNLTDDIKLLAKIKQRIKAVETSYFCNVVSERGGSNSKLAQDCEQRKSTELEPLLSAESALYNKNSILGSPAISELTEDFANDNSAEITSQKNKIKFCEGRKQAGNLRKGEDCEIERRKLRASLDYQNVNIKPEEIDNTIQESLEDSVESSKKLVSRHSNVRLYIKGKLNKVEDDENALKDLRQWIFENRIVAKDYYISTMPSEDAGGQSSFHCRLVKENDANDKNAFVNSLLADAAIMVIPIGAPLLAAKALSKLPRIASSINTAKNSRYAMYGAEGITMAADTALIAKEFSYCEEILQTTYSLQGVPEHMNDEYKECKEQLDTMTTSYVISVLGGAAGIGSSLKAANKARKRLEKNLNDFASVLGKSSDKLTKQELSALEGLNKIKDPRKRALILAELKKQREACK